MSISFFRTRSVAATRKAHTCDACERPIAKGQPATHCAGKVEGDFYNAYYHPDCREAEDYLNLRSGLGGDEYTELWFLYDERNDEELVPASLDLTGELREQWPAVLNRLEEREQARANGKMQSQEAPMK